MLMQCNQLIRLVKEWYGHVKEETMAPARMMQFVDQHVRDCTVCQEDPGIYAEVEKIRGFVLPESKIPKALREQNAEEVPQSIASKDGDDDDEGDDDEGDDDESDDDDD